MKGIAKAILVGGLIVATQAAVAADSAFPRSADDYFGPSVQSTYADSHASDPVTSVGSAIPEGADDPVYGLPARSTYADSHATDPVTIVGSAIPEGADDGEYGLPARSTYADRHLQDPVRISQPAQADTSAD